MAARLSRIDELTRPDHTFLEAADECYYLGEYTARKGFAFSEMNNLINNLRKPMDRKGRPEWRYKESAIAACGRMFREAIGEAWLRSVTLVPIPSSQRRDEVGYDDRLPRILEEVSRGRPYDTRELVTMTRSVEQSHLAGERVSLQELIASMTVDEELAYPAPAAIAVFDDVLTTGRHFKAVQTILGGRFPGASITGMFVARRAPEATLPHG